MWENKSVARDVTKPEQIDDMPNVRLEGAYNPQDLLNGTLPEARKLVHDGVVVVVKPRHVYRERPEGHVLVEVMVREGAFAQHFGVSVILRSPKRLLVKLSPIGYPRPTWGVKEAVRLVAETLMAETGVTIASSTLA
ncbi:MAG: hypothetical protein VX910_04825 [Candidatus Latescibacterota bacterium]|nr:hypothetical protein [Candidatus Latescibacterota bacterium]